MNTRKIKSRTLFGVANKSVRIFPALCNDFYHLLCHALRVRPMILPEPGAEYAIFSRAPIMNRVPLRIELVERLRPKHLQERRAGASHHRPDPYRYWMSAALG